MTPSLLDQSAYFGSSLLLVFLVSLLTFSIFSLMLGYHSLRYSINKKRAIFFFSIYLGGGLVLLLAMAITLYMLS